MAFTLTELFQYIDDKLPNNNKNKALALREVLKRISTFSAEGSTSNNGLIQISPIMIIQDPGDPNGVAIDIPIIPVEPIWEINGYTYTKHTRTIIPIPSAAANDLYRTDRIVGDMYNNIYRVPGTERADVGIPPLLPPNTVEITQVQVYGDTVDNSPPSDTMGYISKSSRKYHIINLPSNSDNILTLGDEITTYKVIRLGDSGTIEGFIWDMGATTYDGMDIYIKNETEGTIDLAHNSGIVSTPFKFNGKVKLTLEPQQLAHLKFNKVDNRVELVGGNIPEMLEAGKNILIEDNKIKVDIPPFEIVSTILGTTGNRPYSITIDSDGNIYTANLVSNNVSKITPEGISTILGTTGNSPYSITIDSDGNIYTANYTSRNVSKITPEGISTILGTTGNSPRSITIDSDGNIYTANYTSNNVSKITPEGVSSILGTTGNRPYSITIDSDGNIYTANLVSNNVSKITPEGVSSILGTTGDSPTAIIIDHQGNVYTANSISSDVTKITPEGISTILGTTGIDPAGIIVDHQGNIYTANYTSNNVSKITSDTKRNLSVDDNGDIIRTDIKDHDLDEFLNESENPFVREEDLDAKYSDSIYVNILDFGATGDGITDDTLSIQDAVDYAYDNNKRVYIPNGEYKIRLQPRFDATSWGRYDARDWISAGLILKESTHIVGEDRDKVIIKLDSDSVQEGINNHSTQSSYIFESYNNYASNIIIENITLDGNYFGITRLAEFDGISISGENQIIQNCNIINVAGDAIDIDEGSINILYCYFNNNGSAINSNIDAGHYMNKSTTVIGCVINNSLLYGLRSRTGSLTVQNSKFKDNKSRHIYINSNATFLIGEVYRSSFIINNEFDGNINIAIDVGNRHVQNHIHIDGNIFRGIIGVIFDVRTGAASGDNVSEVLFTNNTVEENCILGPININGKILFKFQSNNFIKGFKRQIGSDNALVEGENFIGGEFKFAEKKIKIISDATYILLETDCNKILHFTNATGCTVTVPLGLSVNNRYEGKQMGAGQVAFVGASGSVTINKSATDTNKTADQYSVFGLDCTNTDEYVLFGKLELV